MASTLSKFVREYRTENSSEYKMNYRNVSIYPKILEEKRRFTAEEKAHLTRPKFRWYIYYDFREPGTGEFKRQKPFYGKVNREFPDFDDRLDEIRKMKEGVIAALQNNFNPYDVHEVKEYSIESCLDFALEMKKPEVSKRTYDSYAGAAKKFKEWLKKTGYLRTSVKKVDKRLINLHLNNVAAKNSVRTRNNQKTNLSALFSTLVEHEYLEKNILLDISYKKTEEKRDPTFSEEQVKRVISYWEQQNKGMLMFCYFVMYMFWRPKENCRLRVKHVNLKEKTITIPSTKASGVKVKRIPDLIIQELTDYIKGAHPAHLLFTPAGSPGQWSSEIDNRRNYFSELWKNNREGMNLDPEYTIYGLRHTGATRMYRKLIQTYTKDEALQQLRSITGHSSNAIKEYIHYIDADLPEDYSHLL